MKQHGAETRTLVRLHIAILAGIGFFYIATGTSAPSAAFVPEAPGRAELATLEDQFAIDPRDPWVAAELIQQYLDRGRPGLAISLVRANESSLLDHPVVAHRLSAAYEKTGRLLEALATAKVARARCERSLGSVAAGQSTPIPVHGCTEGLLAALSAHEGALDRMVKWGVVFPATDPRTERAYRIALRRARIAARRR